MIPRTERMTRTGIVSSDVYSDEFMHNRRIYLSGPIEDLGATDICAQINHLAAQSNEDIYMIIHSPGGSVTAGLAILDTMRACGCDICTIVSGLAASMGAVIASAGSKGKRYISRHAEMMIHQPLGGAQGQASDIERTAAHIVKIKKKLHSILSENTGIPYDRICVDCDRDYYLDANEAIDYGLADHLFTGFESI